MQHHNTAARARICRYILCVCTVALGFSPSDEGKCAGRQCDNFASPRDEAGISYKALKIINLKYNSISQSHGEIDIFSRRVHKITYELLGICTA